MRLPGTYSSSSTGGSSIDNLNSAVKVETPWRVKASEDMLLLQMPVSYNNETRFTAAYGIVDPMYMHAIPIQLFWHVLEGKTLVKAGTPLAQFVPILLLNLYWKNQLITSNYSNS